MCLCVVCSASFSYGDYGLFKKLYCPELKVLKVSYEDGVGVDFAVKKSAYNAFIRAFSDLYAGKNQVNEINERYFGF